MAAANCEMSGGIGLLDLARPLTRREQGFIAHLRNAFLELNRGKVSLGALDSRYHVADLLRQSQS